MLLRASAVTSLSNGDSGNADADGDADGEGEKASSANLQKKLKFDFMNVPSVPIVAKAAGDAVKSMRKLIGFAVERDLERRL